MPKNNPITYTPGNSSYVKFKIDPYVNFLRKTNYIGVLDDLELTTFVSSNYTSDFEINFRGVSAGEIFNIYQKLILNSQWDCRDNGDYQTIVLGRSHMFYNIDDKIVSISTSERDEIDREIRYKIFLTSPLRFFEQINEKMISDGITNVYDEGTIFKYNINKEKKESNNLKKMIYREKCRKFSENHFAVAGFNLITHSISVNHNVPNTASQVYDEDEKNVVSLLGDVDEQYISEISVQPEVPAASISEAFLTGVNRNTTRNNEYLSNKLLEELRYTYQGNIIIKFNPDVEIGDTITLFDDVTSTFGIFQIDSFEHSLDQRGIITSLIVRASVEPRDPVLDYHAQDIGYKLLDKFPEEFGLHNYADERKKIHKLMSIYLKMLVQHPKYCIFYSKKQKSFFSPTTIRCENVVSPMAVPLRFYPMYVKGVQQIPKSLEYAFVNAGENNFVDLTTKIWEKFKSSLTSFTKKFASGAWNVIYFISDIIISTITFNMSELIKPFFGMTEDNAKEKTFDEIQKMNSDDSLGMIYYNPYDKKYKLMYNNYDYVFGFFNIRLQSRDDLYAANKTLEKNEFNDIKLLSRKVQTVNKLLNDVFDTLFMVELYDGFNITVDGKRYGMNDFLEECVLSTGSSKIEFKEKIMSNYYGSEYGAILTDNESGLINISKDNCKTVNLDGNRKAIEVTVDVTSLNIGKYVKDITKTENIYFDVEQTAVIDKKDSCIEKLIFVFFHNLYGTTMEDKGESSVFERRKNVEILIEKYKEFVDSKTTGVVIMADFNLNVYNWSLGEKPYNGKADDSNFVFGLPNDNFIAKLKSPTTLNQYGFLNGNQYDNVLVSRNINDLVTAKVFEYPEKDKLTISDHVPIYIGIKKAQD